MYKENVRRFGKQAYDSLFYLKRLINKNPKMLKKVIDALNETNNDFVSKEGLNFFLLIKDAEERRTNLLNRFKPLLEYDPEYFQAGFSDGNYSIGKRFHSWDRINQAREN